MAETKEMLVRLIDVEGIHGLIEALSDVVEAAVPVVEGWESDISDSRFEGRLNQLRESMVALNDYVDEHLHDE